MFEFVKGQYGVIFNDVDLETFVKAGWLTWNQYREITGQNNPTLRKDV